MPQRLSLHLGLRAYTEDCRTRDPVLAARMRSEKKMGWTEGFEPSISRATTWRLNRSATPTKISVPCGPHSPLPNRRAAWRPQGCLLSLTWRRKAVNEIEDVATCLAKAGAAVLLSACGA